LRTTGRFLGYPPETVTAAAHDLPELGGLHDDLAVFRAVENGFSILRPDKDAISIATNYLGRPFATLDYFATEDPIIVANLPTRRANTLYAFIGDLFAWAPYRAVCNTVFFVY